MPPLVYRRNKSIFEEATSRDQVGLAPGGDRLPTRMRRCQLNLEPGDCVLLFSDGVTDANNRAGVEFQRDGILATLQEGPWTPRTMGEKLVAAVKQHAAGCRQHDDISVVCFGRTV